MKRFIQGEDRSQGALFPERLDEYISEDHAVRVIDVFVDELDLGKLGFERVIPEVTGRPGYHPAILLKLYVYGYLNRIQSSRRLERETQRNVELMWLTGRLMPDFKTIADFRKDNGKAIRRVCREFVELCRGLDLFTQAVVAIDGSKFKAVNNRDRNDTRSSIRRRIERMEQHIDGYLSKLDASDQEDSGVCDTAVPDLEAKIASMKAEMQRLKKRERAVLAHPDKQLSETDPDSRLMRKSGGVVQVGYNVQTAVDTQHKLIVAHDVTNAPVDRDQLLPTATLAQRALKREDITVLADRGYYKGESIRACHDAGIKALVPKPLTSQSKAAGLFGKQDFHYYAKHDHYCCPAGEVLARRESYVHRGITQITYQASAEACKNCDLKSQCVKGKTRRAVRRSEHEDLLDAMAEELLGMPEAMPIRAGTVEHPFGTIKSWMGATHFLTRRLTNVRTEMSLHVLAYNLKRMINIMGTKPLMDAMRS